MTAPRTDPPIPDPLTAIRRRNSDWQSGEFDGVHEHPDTQCSADIDREWLLASLDAASEPDLECLECGGRIGPRRAALPSAPDQRLREALKHAKYSNHQTHGAHLDHPGTCGGEFVVGNCMVRAALSEATTSPEATLDVERLARALHEVKKVGGPWSPCVTRTADGDMVPVAFDDNSAEDFACLCRAMANHVFAEYDRLAARLRGPA